MREYRVVLGLAALVLTPLAVLWGSDVLRIGYSERSTSWSLLGVSDDGRSLLISYLGSSCHSPDRIEKSETARSVHILVVLERPPFGCNNDDEAEAFQSSVELRQPLAGRELVDRHTDRGPYVHQRPVPWSLVELAESGRAMTISYLGSSCDVLNRVQRRASEDAIEIKVSVLPSLEGGCTARVPRRRVVVFGSPLGDRVILDPRTAEPPPGFPDSG